MRAIETAATVMMTARMEVTAAPVVREQAFQATLENAQRGGATKNEQITRRTRQRRDCQGEKRKRKRKETQDETELE
jgi:hypothetical protein